MDHYSCPVANPRNYVCHPLILAVRQEIEELSWKLIGGTSSRYHWFLFLFCWWGKTHRITSVVGGVHWLICENGDFSMTGALTILLISVNPENVEECSGTLNTRLGFMHALLITYSIQHSTKRHIWIDLCEEQFFFKELWKNLRAISCNFILDTW